VPYRPSSPLPLSLDGGIWTCPGKPNRSVAVTFDPRLLVWLVNQAARRASLTWSCKEGNPPFTVTLT
jgi:hypothetical protein